MLRKRVSRHYTFVNIPGEENWVTEKTCTCNTQNVQQTCGCNGESSSCNEDTTNACHQCICDTVARCVGENITCEVCKPQTAEETYYQYNTTTWNQRQIYRNPVCTGNG